MLTARFTNTFGCIAFSDRRTITDSNSQLLPGDYPGSFHSLAGFDWHYNFPNSLQLAQRLTRNALAPPPSRGKTGEADEDEDVDPREEAVSEGVSLATPKTFDKICCLWPSIRSSMKSD